MWVFNRALNKLVVWLGTSLPVLVALYPFASRQWKVSSEFFGAQAVHRLGCCTYAREQ